MYQTVKSIFKYMNKLSFDFTCTLDKGNVYLSLLFHFELMILNIFTLTLDHRLQMYACMFKIYILLFADDIVIFGSSADELQQNKHLLVAYCKPWKMKVNTLKQS